MPHELQTEFAARGATLRIVARMDGRATCCAPTA
jgi:hypothetical protein